MDLNNHLNIMENKEDKRKPLLAPRQVDHEKFDLISSSSTDQSNYEEEAKDQPDHISDSSNASRDDIDHLANYSGGKSSYHRTKGFGSTTTKSDRLLRKGHQLSRSLKKSQEMTEESYSAEEEDVTPPQYSARISKSSATDLQGSAQKKPPVTGSTLEYDYEETNRFKGHQHGRRQGFMSAEQAESRQIGTDDANNHRNDIDEELKEEVERVGLTNGNNTINFSLMNPASPFKESSELQSSEAKRTSNFVIQRGAVDNKHVRESSNNQSNLMSQDYSYSPDFRDPNNLIMEGANGSELFSPPPLNSRMISTKPLGDPLKTQGMLRYEEFDGECYTNNSSHQDGGAGGHIFFSGGTQNGSATQYYHGGMLDLNRRYSERMSDRIYDRVDPQTGASLSREDEAYSGYNQGEFDLSPSNQPPLIPPSPNNFTRNQTLSIITEEETQHDRKSIYQRMISDNSFGGPFQQTRPSRISYPSQDDGVQRSISGSFPQPQYLDQDFYIKSKSQPMSITNKSGQSRIIINQQQENNPSLESGAGLEQVSHRNTISNISQNYLQINQDPAAYHKSRSLLAEDKSRGGNQRMSYDVKQAQPGDNDSQLFRLYSQEQLIRQSAASNPYGNFAMGENVVLISDEDLLSNIDRYSRLMNQQADLYSDEGGQELPYYRNTTPHSSSIKTAKGGAGQPTHQSTGYNQTFAFDEASMLVKIKEQCTLIDSLKNENQDMRSQIVQKDNIIDDLLSRIEQLQNLHSLAGKKHDAQVQVNIKKHNPYKDQTRAGQVRQGSSNKQTPKRDEGSAPHTIDRHQEGNSSISSISVKQSDTVSWLGKRPSVQETSPRFEMPPFIKTNMTPAQQVKELALQNKQYREIIDSIHKDLMADKEKIEAHDKMMKKLNEEKKMLIKDCDGLNVQIIQLQDIIIEKDKEIDLRKLQEITSIKVLAEVQEKLRILKAKHGESEIVHMEKSTSLTSLLPQVSDQEIQVDLPIFSPHGGYHVRTSSYNSQRHPSLGDTVHFPHTIPLPEQASPLPFQHLQTAHGTQTLDFDVLQGFSSKSGADQSPLSLTQNQPNFSALHLQTPPNQTPYHMFESANGYNFNQATPQAHQVTIINNKQDLSVLLQHHRDYELRAMRLQEELYQHNERLLRENQELNGELARVREDVKVKVKKRDAKVERYKERCSKGAREVAEERARREEAERRTQIARVKAEARIQEKEFKIQGLKMQLRQMSQMGPQMYTTGVVTPAQISMNQGLPRMYSQNELFGAGNNAMQSKMVSAGQQTEYSPRQDLTHQRSRSQDLQQFRSQSKDDELETQKRKHEHFQRLISPTNEDGTSSLGRDESSHFVIMAPSDISMHDFSELQAKRIFDSTLAANTGRYNMASPALSLYRSENLTYSQPKSHQQRDLYPPITGFNLKSPVDQARYPFNPNLVAAQSFEAKPSAASFMLTSSFANQQQIQSPRNAITAPPNTSQQNTITSQKSREQYQKAELREKIKRRADKIQLSRNKKQYETSSERGTTLSGVKKVNRSESQRSGSRSVNKTEHQGRTGETLVTFSHEGVMYPKLNLEKVKLNNAGISSTNSATFRKIASAQNNSPTKNLNSMFNQTSSPFFNQGTQHQLLPNQSLCYPGSPQHPQNHALSQNQSLQTPYLPPHQEHLPPNITTTFDYSSDPLLQYSMILQQHLDDSTSHPPLVGAKLEPHIFTTLKSLEGTMQSQLVLSPPQPSPFLAQNQEAQPLKGQKPKKQDYMRKLEIRERQSRTRQLSRTNNTSLQDLQNQADQTALPSKAPRQPSKKAPILISESQKHLRFERRRSSANATASEVDSGIVNLQIGMLNQDSGMSRDEGGQNAVDKSQRLEDIIRKYGRNAQ